MEPITEEKHSAVNDPELVVTVEDCHSSSDDGEDFSELNPPQENLLRDKSRMTLHARKEELRNKLLEEIHVEPTPPVAPVQHAPLTEQFTVESTQFDPCHPDKISSPPTLPEYEKTLGAAASSTTKNAGEEKGLNIDQVVEGLRLDQYSDEQYMYFLQLITKQSDERKKAQDAKLLLDLENQSIKEMEAERAKAEENKKLVDRPGHIKDTAAKKTNRRVSHPAAFGRSKAKEVSKPESWKSIWDQTEEEVKNGFNTAVAFMRASLVEIRKASAAKFPPMAENAKEEFVLKRLQDNVTPEQAGERWDHDSEMQQKITREAFIQQQMKGNATKAQLEQLWEEKVKPRALLAMKGKMEEDSVKRKCEIAGLEASIKFQVEIARKLEQTKWAVIGTKEQAKTWYHYHVPSYMRAPDEQTAPVEKEGDPKKPKLPTISFETYSTWIVGGRLYPGAIEANVTMLMKQRGELEGEKILSLEMRLASHLIQRGEPPKWGA